MHRARVDDHEQESYDRGKGSIDKICDEGLDILSRFEEFF